MKKVIKLFLFIFLFSIFTSSVKAENRILLSSPVMEVENGKDITVSIDFALESKQYISSARLSYDQNVFESISQSNFILNEDSNWSNIVYNDTNKQFILTNNTGDKINETLKIKFKVKPKTSVLKTTISLNNIMITDGKVETKLKDEKIELNVSKNNEVKAESKIDEGQIKELKVSRKDSFKIIVWVFLAILIVIIMAIYNVVYESIFKYSVLENKMVVNTLLFLEIVICAFLAVYFKNNRGDVNQDTKTDYQDTLDIINYILDVKNNIEEEPKEEVTEDASKMDINHDGKVTIKDAAITIKKSLKNNYKVVLSKLSLSDYTVNKNKNITLNFKADVTPYTRVKYIYIDSLKYKANYTKNNQYTVSLSGLNKTGIHQYKVSKVVLDNGKSFKVSHQISVDVLKEKPSLSDFKMQEKDDVLEITFNLNDKDDSIKEANITLLDNQNIVYKNKVKKGYNNLKIKIAKNKTYNLKIDASYLLSSKEKVDNVNLLNKKFNSTKKVNLEVKDLKVPNIVTLNNKLVITFLANLDIKEVIIDDIKYPVIKDKDLYKIELANLSLGKHNLNIQKFIDKDNQEYDFNKNFEYTVLKNKPVITVLNIKEDETSKTLTVDFKLDDIDNTVEKIVVNLKNEQKEVIDTKEVTKEKQVIFKTADSKVYNIEFLVKYDIDGSQKYQEEVLLNEVFTSKKEVDEIQPEKQEEVEKIKEKNSIEEEPKEVQETNEEPQKEDLPNQDKQENTILVNQIKEDEKKKRLATL